jgi:hypothetical protein
MVGTGGVCNNIIGFLLLTLDKLARFCQEKNRFADSFLCYPFASIHARRLERCVPCRLFFFKKKKKRKMVLKNKLTIKKYIINKF